MDLLTTREAAELAGVGTSAVKRWADAGMLPCVKTAGGHRRFERAAIERLVRGEAPGAAPTDAIGAWVELLLGASDDGIAIEGRLLDERARRGTWLHVAQMLGDVLVAIGERWARGEITVLEEHLASERLARAIARVVIAMPLASTASTALLVAAEGDEHTLGLSLVELCLREAGWRTRWAGRNTPVKDVVRAVSRGDLAMVAISASVVSQDRRALARQVGVIGRACTERGVKLVIGGRGAWPDKPAQAIRCTDLASLQRVAASKRRTR